jgi:hypothetical protein
MATKPTYEQLLRDPRWQRRRLDIFNRDNFACQACCETTRELHVHHVRYIGGPPWESPSEDLQTLCSDCHTNEGIAFVRIDRDYSETTERSVWFRAVNGILEHGASNGCYSWDEPNKALPNARVSRCMINTLTDGEDDTLPTELLVRAARWVLRCDLGTKFPIADFAARSGVSVHLARHMIERGWGWS